MKTFEDFGCVKTNLALFIGFRLCRRPLLKFDDLMIGWIDVYGGMCAVRILPEAWKIGNLKVGKLQEAWKLGNLEVWRLETWVPRQR